MPPVLRLCEDVLADGAALSLPARPRLVVSWCTARSPPAIACCATARPGAAKMRRRSKRAREGATVWRWELEAAETGDVVAGKRRRASPRAKSFRRGSTPCRKGGCSCAVTASPFPPGGCAYLHRHQGPGIRCLIDGGIRIDTDGRSTSYGPGGAWYESGPEPVFAQAADRPTRFIRVMVLPAAYLGESSVEYLNDEDKAKPKSQSTRSSPTCRSARSRLRRHDRQRANGASVRRHEVPSSSQKFHSIEWFRGDCDGWLNRFLTTLRNLGCGDRGIISGGVWRC